MTQLALIVAGLIAGGKFISGGFNMAGKALDKLPSFKTLGVLAIITMLFKHASNNEAFAQSCKNLLGGAYDSVKGFFSGESKAKGAYDTSELLGMFKKLHDEGKLPIISNRALGGFKRLLASANISVEECKKAADAVLEEMKKSLNEQKLSEEDLEGIGLSAKDLATLGLKDLTNLGLCQALEKVQEAKAGAVDDPYKIDKLIKLENLLDKKINEHMKTQEPAEDQIINKLLANPENTALKTRAQIGADSGVYYEPDKIKSAENRIADQEELKDWLIKTVKLVQEQSLTLDGKNLYECKNVEEAKVLIDEKRASLDAKMTELKKTEETLEAELKSIDQERAKLKKQLGDPKKARALLTDDKRRKELIEKLMKEQNDVEIRKIRAELEKLDKLEKTQAELTEIDKKRAEIAANLKSTKNEMKNVEKNRADLDKLPDRVQKEFAFREANGNIAPDHRQVEMYIKLQEAVKAKREELYKKLQFNENNKDLKPKCSPDCIALTPKDAEEILKEVGASFSEKERESAKKWLTDEFNRTEDILKGRRTPIDIKVREGEQKEARNVYTRIK